MKHKLKRVIISRVNTYRYQCSCGQKGPWTRTKRQAQDGYLDHVLAKDFENRVGYHAS